MKLFVDIAVQGGSMWIVTKWANLDLGGYRAIMSLILNIMFAAVGRKIN